MGLWRHDGYFPKRCRMRPKCYTDFISFRPELNFHRPNHNVFESKVTRNGDCEEKEWYDFQDFGTIILML